MLLVSERLLGAALGAELGGEVIWVVRLAGEVFLKQVDYAPRHRFNTGSHYFLGREMLVFSFLACAP